MQQLELEEFHVTAYLGCDRINIVSLPEGVGVHSELSFAKTEKDRQSDYLCALRDFEDDACVSLHPCARSDYADFKVIVTDHRGRIVRRKYFVAG